MKIEPIAHISTPFSQKFAIPRQPNLVPEAVGEIVFTDNFCDPNILRGIEGFSHLWIVFAFHGTADKGWSPTVQPPRLGGKERVGVFASRSPYRPNPIGMSVVRNQGVESKGSRLVLRVGGVDMLDNTPVLDIKPYVAYADSIADATSGFAEISPGHERRIILTPEAQEKLAIIELAQPGIEALIRGVLSQDPRPAWRVNKEDHKQYGMSLYNVNIKWKIDDESVSVIDLDHEAVNKPVTN